MRRRVNIEGSDFLGDVEKREYITYLNHFYNNELEDDDSDKYEQLNDLVSNNEVLNGKMGELNLNLPLNGDGMTGFFDSLTEDQAKALYDAIKSLD